HRAGPHRRRDRVERITAVGDQSGHPAVCGGPCAVILGEHRRAARRYPRMMRPILAALCAMALLSPLPAPAQTAQSLFSARSTPAPHEALPIGRLAQGCIAGGEQLPEPGPTWQAMRLSRNRNWGHSEAISFIREFSHEATRLGWRGLYIGDIGQPRGGPAGG